MTVSARLAERERGDKERENGEKGTRIQRERKREKQTSTEIDMWKQRTRTRFFQTHT